MSKNRYSARTDNNQASIVESLRALGFSVYLDVDDILVGTKGKNFWFEIKDPKHIGSNGKIRESAKKEGQKKLEKEWQGQYHIVSSIDEILEILNEG